MNKDHKDDGAGLSNFHHACKTGKLDAVGAFLSSDPDRIDEKSPEGWTGLIVACFNQQFEVAKLLVENGADVNATNAKGTTVFMYAKTPIQNNDQESTKILDYLLDKGADINRLDIFNKSVLDYVIENGATVLADWLKSKGALIGAEVGE